METLNYYSMIPVNNAEEYLKVVDGKQCKTTDEQMQFVKEQAEKVFGWDSKTSIQISPLGVVFMNSDGEIYTIGRVDAKFNFYSK